MRYITHTGLALVACLLACGCDQADLRDYEPVGPSAEFLLRSLALGFYPYFVSYPEEPPLTVLNLIAAYDFDVARARSSTEGFRMLCALVNRYFGDWERLVIIERLQRGGWVDTGFIVVGVTRDKMIGVTNFDPKGHDGIRWSSTVRLRTFRVDRAKFESCLAELDKMHESTTIRPLLWFTQRDWCFYFLHDIRIRRDRDPAASPFRPTSRCFAFTGWPTDLPEDQRVRLAKAPRDYARAQEILDKHKPWQEYDPDSEAMQELREAGATYASLLSLLWESTLGQPDYGVLGVYPSPELHP